MHVKMTEHEARLVVGFLEDLSEKYGAAGCNDYPMLNTQENRDLLASAYRRNGEPDREAEWLGEKIIAIDFEVVDELIARLEAEINAIR